MRLVLDLYYSDAGPWTEQKHARGQPKNKGQFARKGTSAARPQPAQPSAPHRPVRPAQPAAQPAAPQQPAKPGGPAGWGPVEVPNSFGGQATVFVNPSEGDLARLMMKAYGRKGSGDEEEDYSEELGDYLRVSADGEKAAFWPGDAALHVDVENQIGFRKTANGQMSFSGELPFMKAREVDTPTLEATYPYRLGAFRVGLANINGSVDEEEIPASLYSRPPSSDREPDKAYQ